MARATFLGQKPVYIDDPNVLKAGLDRGDGTPIEAPVELVHNYFPNDLMHEGDA